jgi:hypothetical protein
VYVLTASDSATVEAASTIKDILFLAYLPPPPVRLRFRFRYLDPCNRASITKDLSALLLKRVPLRSFFKPETLDTLKQQKETTAAMARAALLVALVASLAVFSSAQSCPSADFTPCYTAGGVPGVSSGVSTSPLA